MKKIYGEDSAELSGAMQDNLEFMNTHPNLAGFLMGLMVSLYEKGAPRSTVKGLKVALFGPIAGIGDAVFWFSVLPIVAGISCSFAAEGSLLGPIIFFLTYLAIWLLRIVWTRLGYTLGTRSIDVIKENSEIIANSATILGITVIGALIGTYVNVKLLPVVSVGGGIKVSLQTDFFDKIIPNLLPVCITFALFALLKKKASPIVLIVVVIVASMAAAALGVL